MQKIKEIIEKIKNFKLENIFLMLIIPIGLAYTFAILPLNVPDELAHIRRSYNISNLQIIERKNEQGEAITQVPKELREYDVDNIKTYGQVLELLKTKTDYNNVEHIHNPAQGYSPTSYVFSAIAFFICRVTDLNIWIAIYLARIINLAVVIILGYFSIKYLPIGKLVLLVYMLNPIFIQQSASVSCDAIINACIIAYISFTTYLIINKDILTRKNKIIYAILALNVALAKYIYMPIIFINICLIFKKDFNKKDKIYISIISIICIICTFGWYLIGTRYEDTSQIVKEYNSSPSGQIDYLLHNKRNIPIIIKNTFKVYTMQWTKEFLGGSLGYLRIYPEVWVTFGYGIILLLSIFLEKNEKKLNKFQRSIYFLIAFGIFWLVLIALHLLWSPVGYLEVMGVQGRYFIPIGLLVFLSLKFNKLSYNLKYSGIIFSVLLVIIHIGELSTVINYFS